MLRTLLIDGNSLLKTSYHGIKNMYWKDIHIGGLCGFMRITQKLIKENYINRVIVFWDSPESGKLKSEIYPLYKITRNNRFIKNPNEKEEIWLQKERLKQYFEELYIRHYEDTVAESDDCIGFYCNNLREEKETIIIISGDKDFFQLINDKVSLYFLPKKIIITKNNYKHYLNYHYKNSFLVKVIEGCQSDCISGIQGIGEKTLLDLFPELIKEEVSFDWIIKRSKELIQEKNLKSLQNIIDGKSKNDEFVGEKFWETNKKIIDLTNPLINEITKENIEIHTKTPINPEKRDIKNFLKLINEDGFINCLSGDYTEFIKPFLNIIKNEQNYGKNN